MRLFIPYLFVLASITCSAQNKVVKSLIVAEYKKDSEGVGSYTYLVRYNFLQGELISKDTILGAPVIREGIAGSYVRYDLGKNQIYKNRYVISGAGNVIDIQTKNLLVESTDQFIDAKGDSIIFHRANIFTGTGFLVLNLNDKTYDFVKDKTYRSTKGILSPDLKRGLEVDRSRLPYRILLYGKQNDSITIVKDCGTGTNLSAFSSSMPTVPLIWLDNSSFLYANYGAAVEIRKVHIPTRANDLIVRIDSVLPDVSNASFSAGVNGDILFECSKGTFKIDPNLKTLTVQTHREHGNQFTSEWEGDKKGIAIAYKKEQIGKFWCSNYKAVTTGDYFAVEYGPRGSNLGYPKGIKVWSVEKGKWVTIDVPWLCAVVGWVE